jgi:hypothetical protein
MTHPACEMKQSKIRRWLAQFGERAGRIVFPKAISGAKGVQTVSQDEALSTLGNPWATETAWTSALATLGKDSSRPGAERIAPGFLRRFTALFILYAIEMSVFALVGPLLCPWLHHYGLVEILLLASCWAAVESLTGLATLGGVVLLIQNWGSPGQIVNPTWILVLTNVLLYAKLGWEPSVLTWGRKALVHFRERRIRRLPGRLTD